MKSIKWIILLIFCSCGQNNKLVYSSTLDADKRIFLEKYKTFAGGVFAGNSYKYYLTDSLNFKIKIAETNFDDERIEFVLKDQELKIIKLQKILDISKYQEDTVSIEIIELFN